LESEKRLLNDILRRLIEEDESSDREDDEDFDFEKELESIIEAYSTDYVKLKEEILKLQKRADKKLNHGKKLELE
jgi:DNA primase large subunit